MESTIEVTSAECPQDFISHVEFLNVDSNEEKGNLLVASWDSVRFILIANNQYKTKTKKQTNILSFWCPIDCIPL
jgi:hypothetical protein